MEKSTKICNKCNTEKQISEFRSKRCICKKCEQVHKTNYLRTKRGLVFQMYLSQKQSSKRRGHNPPNYTNIELYDWVIHQDNFKSLYEKWIKSGYEKMEVPSVDRIDDNKPYSFDNILLTDWRTNKAKLHTDLISGKYICKHKKVLQYDKDMNLLNSFFSMSEAHRVTGASISKISLVCNNKRKSHFGCIWRFDNEKNT